MTLSHPQVLRSFLEEAGFAAQKRLSQHFLVDRSVIQSMVTAAQAEGVSRVVEIGPGPGAITEALLLAGMRVCAVELDRGFSQALRDRHWDGLTLIEGDALKVSLDVLLAGGAEALVSNLPYAITAPILARFLPLHHQLKRLVVMMQLEVAERILASPGTKQWGLLSLLVQGYATPHLVRRVPAAAVRPVPKVDAAVLCLSLHPPDPVLELALELARHAFQQRRKMLRSSLRGMLVGRDVARLLVVAGLSPEQRPEQLSLDQWLTLARMVLAIDKSPDPNG